MVPLDTKARATSPCPWQRRGDLNSWPVSSQMHFPSPPRGHPTTAPAALGVCRGEGIRQPLSSCCGNIPGCGATTFYHLPSPPAGVPASSAPLLVHWGNFVHEDWPTTVRLWWSSFLNIPSMTLALTRVFPLGWVMIFGDILVSRVFPGRDGEQKSFPTHITTNPSARAVPRTDFLCASSDNPSLQFRKMSWAFKKQERK